METIRFGADEAGKGPVMGPMVVCAVRADINILPTGIDDSKKLTPSKRRGLHKSLINMDSLEYATVHVTAKQIDESEKNMTELGTDAFISALNMVIEEGNGGAIDTAHSNPDEFKRTVESQLNKSVHLKCEHGADEKFPMVGAASIIAKVERDKRMAEINDEFEMPVGSGYPSDSTTITFLENYIRNHNELPQYTRKSWSTAENIIEEYNQQSLDDF